MVDGPNTYGFCGGDPVNRSDPMGTDWWVVDDQGQPLAGPFEATSKGRDAAYSAAAHLKGIGFGSYAKARVAYYLPEEEAELVTLDGGRQVTRRENFMALADQATSALSDPWRLKVMYEMSTGSNLDDEFLGAVAACVVDQFERGAALTPYVSGARYALETLGEWVEPYEEEMIMAQAYCMQLPPGWNATVLFPLAGRGLMRLVIVGGKLVSASRTVIGATALKGAAAFKASLGAASKAYGFLKANVRIEGTAMMLPNVRLGPAAKAVARTWQEYEQTVRSLYGAASFQSRKYAAMVGNELVRGVADNVTEIGGRRVAVEAKLCDDWATSLRNPSSPCGQMPFAIEEQQTMVNQARKYSSAFDEVIYHSNSRQLIDYYTKRFKAEGITKFRFILTE